MKKYLIIFCFLIFYDIYCQENITLAIYQEDFYSGIGHISSTYDMFFTSKESLYLDRTNNNEEISDKLNEINTEYNPMLIGETHSQFYYRNRPNKKIFFNQISLRREYLVYEKEEELMKWKLIDETRDIGKFTCYKAMTLFKGREYTAWYTIEIPVPIGPRKFGGLPGLIISITDNANKYSSKMVGISQYKNPQQESIFKPYSSMNVISFDSFKHFYCEDLKIFEKILISKMPRGNSLVSMSVGLGSDENLEIFKFTCEN